MNAPATTHHRVRIRSIILLLVLAVLAVGFRPAQANAAVDQPIPESADKQDALQTIEDAILSGVTPETAEVKALDARGKLGSRDRSNSSFEPSEIEGVEGPASVDTVLVKLKTSASPEVLPDATKVVDDWYRVKTGADETVAEAIERLQSHPSVQLATASHAAEVEPPTKQKTQPRATGTKQAAGSTNDPLVGLQWHLDQIRAFDAQKTTKGSGVTVAILDTGIARDGADLKCRTFVSSYNALDNTTSVKLDINHPKGGHGTHVAGTVAQCTGNGTGVAGVAPGVKLMDVKVCGVVSGSSLTCPDWAVAAGIKWAISHGADVINMSLGWGCQHTYPSCSRAILNEQMDKAAAADVVVVVSSGNDGRGFVGTPANHPKAISVASVDTRAVRASYSNYGSGLDIAAPGGDMSVDRNGDGYSDGVLQQTFATGGTFGYHFYQGTSMAAPHVAGAAALVRAAFPTANRSDVKNALLNTATDLGSSGKDTRYGAGLLRADRAVKYFASSTTAPKVTMKPARFKSGNQAKTSGHVPVKIDWSTSSSNGVADYNVAVSINGGTYQALTHDGTKSEGVWRLKVKKSYRFAVQAVDKAGNASDWEYTTTFKPKAYGERNDYVTLSSGWTVYKTDSAFGGAYAYSTTKNASAQLKFKGRAVAVMAPKWASGKKLDVYIDGKFVKTVSLYKSSTSHRRMVASYYWSSKGTHTIKIVVRGASGGPNAAFDAFTVLH